MIGDLEVGRPLRLRRNWMIGAAVRYPVMPNVVRFPSHMFMRTMAK
jgi:hypothetical protein